MEGGVTDQKVTRPIELSISGRVAVILDGQIAKSQRQFGTHQMLGNGPRLPPLRGDIEYVANVGQGRVAGLNFGVKFLAVIVAGDWVSHEPSLHRISDFSALRVA
jgi:hypothetical protein